MDLENIGTIDLFINRTLLTVLDSEFTLCTGVAGINSGIKLNIPPGTDVFKTFKKFKPVYTEYPWFNSLLTELKLYHQQQQSDSELTTQCIHYNNLLQPTICNSDQPYCFKNNYDFINTIISIPNKKITDFKVVIDNKLDKISIILYSNNKYDSPLIHHYRSHKFKECSELGVGSCIEEQPGVLFTESQVKHELANSLNIINMSSMLINKNLEDPDTINKYNQLIRSELESTINVLNMANTMPPDSESNNILLTDFYCFIDKYLVDINKIYSIQEDGEIIISTSPDKLQSAYVNIRLPWLKIILDNIFKNIYGHLGSYTNKKFKSFIMSANPSTTSIGFTGAGTAIIIQINNTILQESDININRCILYKEITDKYNLPDEHNSFSYMTHKNMYQGINIIDALCKKLNIQWKLYEIETNNYCFELIIPIINKINKSAGTSHVAGVNSYCRHYENILFNNKAARFVNENQYIKTSTI